MEVIAVKEEDGTHKKWCEEAKAVKTVAHLAVFVTRMRDGYQHDYGTICHAAAASAIAAANCVDAGPAGGITGFQASAIFWEFTKAWGCFSSDGPKKMVMFENLLYPQYDHDFAGCPVTRSTKAWLVQEANKKLGESVKAESTVEKRWKLWADGGHPDFVRIVES